MRAVVAALLLLPLAATAWPVDWVHDVPASGEKFIRLPRVDWVEVDDPLTAQAEWFEASNELVLVGLKPGRALVLLGSEGKVAVWRVRVGGKPLLNDAGYASAQKACPDFKATPLEDVKLTVTVKTEACRVALVALFQTDAFEARHLELTFEGAVLQTQLKLIQAAIDTVVKGKVTARYLGAGLVLNGGKVTQAQYRRILWEVLRNSLGRFALDNRVEVEAPFTLDAGAR